jgi:hypothetical protein
LHNLLIQLDGKLPNLALMKLGHWHLSRGDTVEYSRSYKRDLFDQRPDRVYISSIFDFTQIKLMKAMHAFPEAIVGGTGTPFKKRTVEEIIGQSIYEHHDYSGYGDFTDSIGYAMRGCRMATPKSVCRNFCVVPEKEGLPYSVNNIAAIWRGEPYPRKLHLLDNDFFGNPQWRERVAEIKDGGFKVCMSQGINTRLLNDEAAKALASIEYRDDSFSQRRLYTAWDNFGDEGVFFRGVDRLERHGIPGRHLMAFMLIGCDPEETWGRIWERFTKMVEREILPYPMVFRKSRKDLVCWQRYVIRGFYRWKPWDEYERQTQLPESVEAWRPYADRLAAAMPKLQKEAA